MPPDAVVATFPLSIARMDPLSPVLPTTRRRTSSRLFHNLNGKRSGVPILKSTTLLILQPAHHIGQNPAIIT